MLARIKSTTTPTALLALLTPLPLLILFTVLLLLTLCTPAPVTAQEIMGFACSDTACKNGIKSFPGPPIGAARSLPAFTAAWFSNEVGGKVCRGSGGDKCKTCDSISSKGHCYNSGPYYYWCPS